MHISFGVHTRTSISLLACVLGRAYLFWRAYQYAHISFGVQQCSFGKHIHTGPFCRRSHGSFHMHSRIASLCPLTYSLSLSLSLSFARSLSRTLSLTHANTHTRTLSLALSHSVSLSRTLSLSHANTHTRTLSRSLSVCESFSHALSLPLVLVQS